MKLWEWDKITTPKIAQNIYINESFFFRWDHIFASDSFANLRKFHTRGYRSNPFLQPPWARIFVSGMLSVSVSMWGESCWMTRSILSTYLERDERKVFLQRNGLFSMQCFLYYFSNLSLIRAFIACNSRFKPAEGLGAFLPEHSPIQLSWIPLLQSNGLRRWSMMASPISSACWIFAWTRGSDIEAPCRLNKLTTLRHSPLLFLNHGWLLLGVFFITSGNFFF